jgi:predicted anti-sigma-YlaC factor YlaD
MSCRDTIHLICWYLEGKLSPAVSQDIEQHLHDCSNCQLVLKAATRTLDQYFRPETPENASQAA